MHNNPSLHVQGFTGGGDILRGFNTEVGFTAPHLKPCFHLFQRVQDQLYLTPPTLEEDTSSAGAYLGALGFSQPLEKLVLCAVPLQSLLDWLSQPKGPNLVEASMAAAPDRALVFAVMKQMLYGEETPLVGVGLMYKPHYISTEPFSAAYMHLHVWHATGSSVESVNRLSSSRLMFVTVLEMSDVIPVASQHPVLLDVATKEATAKTGEPMAPLSFRGFQLRTVWTRPPGGDSDCQVASPHHQGEATASMLEYEQEKFPQSLMQGPKMAINLRPPSSNHWNIVSDLVLPLTVDMYKQRHEAKRAEQDPEGESVGAEGSPNEAPAPGKAPQAVACGSKVASPTETTHQGERALETTLGILKHVHALHLQTLHDMGGMRELEQTVVCTLMAEFARLQSILGEDLTRSLSALCSELETSIEALSSDLLSILNLHSGDQAFPWVKELIQKHHQSISMKVNLPLIELEAAREDLERILQRRLHKLSSDPKSQEMVKELSQTLSTYANRIREVILVPGIEEPAVFNRVMLGLAVDQPLEAILFPGILDGLSGRLSLTPLGVVDPPTSARDGVSRRWAATLREAVMKTEGRDINLDQVTPHVVHPGLHQDYGLDFRMRRVDDIAPTLTSPMLSGFVSSVRSIGRPEVPRGSASPKTEEGLWGLSGAPTGPDAPGPSCIGRSAPHVRVAKGNKLYK